MHASTALKRLGKDFKALQDEPIINTSAAPTNDMTLWHGNILIPLTASDGTDLSCTMHFLMHFQPDYPRSAPHVGFCTKFPWDGATKTPSQGPLKGLQEICLNILGNFDFVHDEWAGIQGEGWSAGMTVSSLLVTLQSTLITLTLNDKQKYELKRMCDATVVNVDGEKHTGLKPYPPLATATQKVKCETQKDTRACYFTCNTAEEDVLGFGAFIENRQVKTDGEIISLEAYEKHNVRMTSYKKPFTHFLPCFIAPAHGGTPTWKKTLVDSCQRIMHQSGDADVACVLARLMNSMTVELMKQEKAAAVSFFEAYCSFWRSLYFLFGGNAAKKAEFTTKLQNFALNEKSREKDACPDVGMMLALYTVLPDTVSRDDFVDAYLDESMLRQVLWWQKENMFPINGRNTYDFSKVSRELLLFNLRVLDIIVPGGDANRAAAEMDASFGRVPERLELLLEESKKSVANSRNGTWEVFFSEARARPETINKVKSNSGTDYVQLLIKRAAERGHKYTFTKGDGKGKGGKNSGKDGKGKDSGKDGKGKGKGWKSDKGKTHW